MIRDTELDAVLSEWFGEGPTRLEERVLRAAFAEVRSTPRGSARRLWPLRAGRGGVPVAVRLAFAAVLLVLLFAAVLLAGGVMRRDDEPSPKPSASLEPTPAPSAADSAPPFGGGAAALGATWTTTDPAPGLPDGEWVLTLGRLALVSRAASDTETVKREWHLWLAPVQLEGDRISIAAPKTGDCAGQSATYHWTIDATDVLRLVPIEEACPARRSALADREWRRGGGIVGPGAAGKTYSFAGFRAPFDLTVPASARDILITRGSHDYEVDVTHAGTEYRLIIADVTELLVDPCDTERGARPVQGAAAVVAGLRAIQRISVGPATASTVGGRSAQRLDITAPPGAADRCRRGIIAYWLDQGERAGILPDDGSGHWTRGGTRDRIDVLEVRGRTVAVAVQAPIATFDAWLRGAQSIIDSITFR